MLIQAPSIYIPNKEKNGITIPSLLSIIVHALIVGFVVFSHKIPIVEEPEPIETSLITAEELASLQANALASSVSSATEGDVFANAEATGSVSEDASNSTENDAIAQMVRKSVSVFTRSDAPPDQYGMPEDVIADNGFDREAYADQLARKQAEYDRAREEYERQMMAQTEAEQSAYEEFLEARRQVEEARLAALRHAEANPTPVDKPKIDDKTLPTLTRSKSNDSGKGSVNINLSDGTPIEGSEGMRETSGGSVTSSSGGKNSSAIVADLRRIIEPVVNRRTPANIQPQQVNVKVTVDARGNVTGVSVFTSDKNLKSSVASAIYSLPPLTPMVGTEYNSLTVPININ